MYDRELGGTINYSFGWWYRPVSDAYICDLGDMLHVIKKEKGQCTHVYKMSCPGWDCSSDSCGHLGVLLRI